MNFGRWIFWALAWAALALGSAGGAGAQEPAAGRFIAVVGDVQVLGRDGGRRLAVRNADIRPGESIVTGKDSLAQLRMSDGGALSVRSETEIKLDAYRYSGRKEASDNFLVSILRGGFRTITGLIARNNRTNFHVQTSAMTIGVRGTDFEVVHVVKPAADAVPGTYNRVYDGITTMQGRTGPLVLANRDQTFFVPLAGNLPPAPVLPPDSLFGKPTPVPPAAVRSRRDANPKDGLDKEPVRAIRELPAVQEKAQEVAPATSPASAPVKSMSAPLLNPIDTPRAVESAPALPTAPASTLQISPITAPLTAPTVKSIEPAPATEPLKTTTTPALTAPVTTTISPLSSPTTTVAPVLTAPTTTISPVQTAPVKTIVSPVITAPTTTIQTTPLPTTTIKR